MTRSAHLVLARIGGFVSAKSPVASCFAQSFGRDRECPPSKQVSLLRCCCPNAVYAYERTARESGRPSSGCRSAAKLDPRGPQDSNPYLHRSVNDTIYDLLLVINHLTLKAYPSGSGPTMGSDKGGRLG